MKKTLYLWLSLLVIISSITSISLAQDPTPGNEKKGDSQGEWTVEQDPIWVLDTVKRNANKDRSDEVQNTKLDYTMSECIGDSVPWWAWFTITKTLCNIKVNIRAYLQYIVFAWLTLATIFLIRNGFQLVTSPDRSKQMWTFRKNITYIIIGVILLISFYYILDIFVTLVNFVTE
jgi:hypothetical protein